MQTSSPVRDEIRTPVYDAGWLYRVRPTRGDVPAVARNKEGEYWFWDFEVAPLGRRKRQPGGIRNIPESALPGGDCHALICTDV
jgi:hypothetical protein